MGQLAKGSSEGSESTSILNQSKCRVFEQAIKNTTAAVRSRMISKPIFQPKLRAVLRSCVPRGVLPGRRYTVRGNDAKNPDENNNKNSTTKYNRTKKIYHATTLVIYEQPQQNARYAIKSTIRASIRGKKTTPYHTYSRLTNARGRGIVIPGP